MRTWRFLSISLIVFVTLLVPRIVPAAIQDPGTQLTDVGIDPSLGHQIDLSLRFQDETGETKPLSQFLLPDRPTIIIPAYYHCPRLCGLLLRGVAGLLSELKLRLGQDYNVITVSFDLKDTPKIAAQSAAEFRALLTPADLQASAKNWHFLVGTKENVHPLLRSIGFKYKEDGEEFLHTAAIFLVTANGVLSQYFAGVTFNPKDVRYGLVQASKGAIGSALDQVFLYCFAYDHLAGKYVWVAFDIMRAGGLLTLSFLLFLFYRLRKFEKTNRVGKAPA